MDKKLGLEIERWSSATSTIEAIFHFPWYPSSVVLRLSFAPLFSSCRLNRISKQFITPTPGAHLYPYQRSLVAPCKRLLLRVEPPTGQQSTLTSANNNSFSLSLSFSLSSPSPLSPFLSLLFLPSLSLSLSLDSFGPSAWVKRAGHPLLYLFVTRMEIVRKGRKNYIGWKNAWNFPFRVIFINFRERSFRYFRVEIISLHGSCFSVIIKSF